MELTPQDVARLEAAVPANSAAGTRYDAHQMRILDSERGASGAPRGAPRGLDVRSIAPYFPGQIRLR